MCVCVCAFACMQEHVLISGFIFVQNFKPMYTILQNKVNVSIKIFVCYSRLCVCVCVCVSVCVRERERERERERDWKTCQP